jgi:hypothetical protein
MTMEKKRLTGTVAQEGHIPVVLVAPAGRVFQAYREGQFHPEVRTLPLAPARLSAQAALAVRLAPLAPAYLQAPGSRAGLVALASRAALFRQYP